jgi:hypothetical protein
MTSPAFSALREVRRRRSTDSAIFQAFIHLTLGFVIIAGLRTPALNEKALDVARLQEQLYAERGKGRELRGALLAIQEVFGTTDLPLSVVLQQVALASKRLVNTEALAVENLPDTYTPADGSLPTLTFLREAVRRHPPQAAGAADGIREDLLRHRERLAQLLAEDVARRTDTEPTLLFQATRDRIAERARKILADSLRRDCALLVKQAATQEEEALDWSAFDGKPLSEGPGRAKQEHGQAYQTFSDRVRGHVPPPEALGLPEDLVVKVVDEAFEGRCEALRREDEALAAGLAVPDRPQLAAEDLWKDDLPAFVRSRLCQVFNVPEKAGRVGPRAEARLSEVARQTYRRDLDQLIPAVAVRVRQASWDQVRRAGVAAVVYDDHAEARRRKRLEEVRNRLGPGVGLPEGRPGPDDAARSYDEACRARAAELFGEQLRQALRAVEEEIKGHGQELVREVAEGRGEIALSARDDPQKAARLVAEGFWKARSIASPYRGEQGGSDHERLLWQRAVQIVMDGTNRAAESIVNDTPTDNLAVLKKLGLRDAGRKADWVPLIVKDLESRSKAGPEGAPGANLNRLVRAEFARKAAELFDQQMQKLKRELLARARQRVIELAEQVPPAEWKNKSDDRIVEEILEKVVQELDLAVSKEAK